MVRPPLAVACLAGLLAGPALAATHTTTANLLSVLAKPIASARRGKARVFVPATIEWKERGVLYTIQWRAGTKATMIALADTAIEAGPR